MEKRITVSVSLTAYAFPNSAVTVKYFFIIHSIYHTIDNLNVNGLQNVNTKCFSYEWLNFTGVSFWILLVLNFELKRVYKSPMNHLFHINIHNMTLTKCLFLTFSKHHLIAQYGIRWIKQSSINSHIKNTPNSENAGPHKCNVVLSFLIKIMIKSLKNVFEIQI